MTKNIPAAVTAAVLLLAALAIAFTLPAPQLYADAADIGETETSDVTAEETSPPPETPYNGAVLFEPSETLHSDAFTVTLSVNVPEGKELSMIVYTTDGSEPGRTARVYSGVAGIPVGSAGSVTGTVISARALFTDGTWTDTAVRTYLTGEDVDERFDTLIFSVVGDPDGFFSWENGILIAGKRRADYIAAHPGQSIDPPDPANWNFPGDQGLRKSHLEIFTQDGTLLLSQVIDVSVQGGWSRAQAQKSLRLTARADYGSNRFRVSLFDGINALSSAGTRIASYQRLTLRNNANDSGMSNLRDEVIQQLAWEGGFLDTQSAVPASVFLNGEYWGFEWLKETYDDEYFDEHYGNENPDCTGTFVVLEGGDASRKESSKIGLVYRRGYYDWEEMQSLGKRDLTNDRNYEALCEVLDVENYLRYFAVQLYVCNTDWPHNNNKIYRYYAGEGEEYVEGTVFDGRWRQLLFDTDFGLHGSGGGPGTDNIARTLNKHDGGYSPVFSHLMEREDCREYFAAYCYELMNGAFSPSHAKEVVDEIADLRINELTHHVRECDYSSGVSLETADYHVELCKEFLEERPATFRRLLASYFDVTEEQYRIVVTDDSTGGYFIGDYRTSGSFGGSWSRDLTVTLTAAPGRLERFSHWEINGETYDTLSIMLDASMVKGGRITVKLVTEPSESEQRPILYALTAKGAMDTVTLINPYDTDVRTTGMSVSDDPDDPLKYILPVVTIAPGETLTVLCKNYTGADAVGQSRTNFSLSAGETLVLAYDGGIVDSVTIPDLSGTGVYTLNVEQGGWTEQ